MLIDEVRSEEAAGAKMVVKDGVCRFCGQLLTIRCPEDWTHAEHDELATQACRCNDALIYTNRQRKLEVLDRTMTELFGSESERKLAEDTVSSIHDTAMLVISGKIVKSTVELSAENEDEQGEKVKIYMKKDMLHIDIEKKTHSGAMV